MIIASSIACGVASGSTHSVTASGMPPAQLGRSSRNSQRATHTTISGTGRASRTSCSIRSSSKRVGLLQVLEHEHDRAVGREAGEHREDAAAHLGRVVAVVPVAVATQAEREPQAARGALDLVGVDPSADPLAEPPEHLLLGRAALLADLAVHHLGERPERDLLLERARAAGSAP